MTLVTQYQSEFALHARAILGLPVDTAMSSPGASAVIYGGTDASAMTFAGVDNALEIPGTDIRLFGKPESFVKRRMGVALARSAGAGEMRSGDTDDARRRAKQAAACVTPRPSR